MSVEKKRVLRLRFPDGTVAIRWTGRELPVGVLVRSRGALWRVVASQPGRVVLAPASHEDTAQHGPTMKATPLGDEPVLLERMLEI